MKKERVPRVDLSGLTYTELVKRYMKDDITDAQLKDFYRCKRKYALELVRKIERSDVPFADNEKPYFRTGQTLVLTSDILHAIADVNKFLTSKTRTVKGRKERRTKAVNTLRERGFNFVTEKNYFEFNTFMKWFRATEYSKMFGSDSTVVDSVFRRAEDKNMSNAAGWEKLFNEYKKSGKVSGKRIARSRAK